MSGGKMMGILLAATIALSLPHRVVMAADSGAMSTAKVDISNFAFSPKTVTIAVGTRVVWTNRDEEPHVVTSAGAQFASSKALDTSDRYAVTFSKPGTYTYYCSIHPMMVGTIIVR